MILACLCSSAVSRATKAQDVAPITVEEWSIWVGSPAFERLNDRNAARNAMPASIGTARARQTAGGPGEFAIAPASVIRFLGDPITDLDLELRVTSGSFLAHWPPARERVDSLRWFGANLSNPIHDDLSRVFLPESHPFCSLRDLNDSLVIEVERRAESFLAYDAELAIPIPLTLEGGPDAYTLQNVSEHPLHDLALIVPTDGGYRIGWLDELPAGQSSEDSADTDSPNRSKDDAAPASSTDSNHDPALDLFDNDPEHEDQNRDENPPPPQNSPLAPLPAEADASVRARTEQLLNQPVVFDGSEIPIADALQRIRTQAGLQTTLDTPTLADAAIDLDSKTVTPPPGQRSARDVLSEILDHAGLTYRIIQDGTLFLSTPERLDADTDLRKAQVKGPPVTLTLSDVFPASDPDYADMSEREFSRRLGRQGLGEARVKAMLDDSGADLFRPDRLIVMAHLAQDALEQAVPLDVFPPAQRTVRIATVIISGIDPGLVDQAEQLIAQLGDPSPRVRDTAERDLFTLGPVAVPALNEALNHQDLEIVVRAERLLRRLNRPLP